MKKKCTGCGNDKDESEFPFASSDHTTRRAQCKECKSDQHRVYRVQHVEQERLRNKVHAEKYPCRRWAQNTINHHRGRGFDIKLSRQELEDVALKTKCCPLCGCELDWSVFVNKHVVPSSPTLDRIHNEKYISMDNIIIICHACNSGKTQGSLEDYISRCKRIASRFGG